MDVVGAALLLVLFSPVIAVIALAILMTSGGPVLFRQVRPGLHGEPFTLHKFRTMRDPRPDEEAWTTDEARTTRLGRFLRRTSLDELPELTLVLTGRMSLVGPRPLVMEYLPRYSAHHARRHDVRPGITGLTQVSGRRSLTFGQRLDLDVSYLDNWSLWLDLKILLRTMAEPFRRGEIVGQTPAEVDDIGLVPPVLERVR
ncbi:sugar transferase [Micromonospora sp. NPDC005299]|uniref:sugar transferase n=1 Tax=Micromonospora sp. NPDC005299 TaxID=3364231 RepID=UPI0036C56E6B